MSDVSQGMRDILLALVAICVSRSETWTQDRHGRPGLIRNMRAMLTTRPYPAPSIRSLSRFCVQDAASASRLLTSHRWDRPCCGATVKKRWDAGDIQPRAENLLQVPDNCHV